MNREVQSFTDAEMLALRPMLKSYALKLTRGDLARTEDLVQDTMMLMLENREKFLRGTNLGAWAGTILHHRLFTMLRKERGSHIKGGKQLLNEAPVELQSDYDSPARSDQHMVVELREVLALLDANGAKGQAVLLIAMGFTLEEAAQELGVDTGTVKSRTCRGRNELDEALGITDRGRRGGERSRRWGKKFVA